jgi:hypothetical protein
MEERIEQLSLKLYRYFKASRIEELGEKSLFVQRSSAKLGSYAFLLMNIFDRRSSKERSLNDSCDWLEEYFGISLSKQSLDERYNTYAVSFMKSCFEELLSEINSLELKKINLKSFSSIQLTDSTSFRIGDNLSDFYKGYKGNAGPSVLKIHLNYDLLNGQIEEIRLGDGSVHDNAYTFGKDEKIKPAGLYLRDLGYYSFDYFRQLEESDAYFLSRAKTNVTFYQKDKQGNYKKMSWEKYLPAKGETNDIAEVYLGSYKDKLRVRLVVESVPEAVSKKLKEYAQKQKDKRVSEQRKAMCYYNVFITNAPVEKIATHQIRAVYSLRWQVEIMFKLWKSHYNIDKVKKMSIFRFECHIYAQLIVALLDFTLQQVMEPIFLNELERELSPIKATKLIKKTL